LSKWNIGFSLCERVKAIESVTGFSKRESKKQTVCAFLGFEGARLKNIFDVVHDIEKFITVIAFPSGSPQWYNIAMWNSMGIFLTERDDFVIQKCFSEGVFEAVDLLKNSISQQESAVLVPFSTRPHQWLVRYLHVIIRMHELYMIMLKRVSLVLLELHT
jgi:hypothetical protein